MVGVTGRPAVPVKPNSLRSHSNNLSNIKQLNSNTPPPLPARPSRKELNFQVLDDTGCVREGPAFPSRINSKRDLNGKTLTAVSVYDDIVVGISNQCQVLGWDIHSGEIKWTYFGTEILKCLVFMNTDIICVGSNAGNLLFIDVVEGSLVKSMNISGRPIVTVQVIEGGLYAMDTDGWVHFWEVVKEKIISADDKIGVTRVIERAECFHLNSPKYDYNGLLWLSIGRLVEIHKKSKDGGGLILLARFEIDIDLGVEGVTNIIGITSVGENVVTAHEDGSLLIWNNLLPVKGFRIMIHGRITAIHGSDDYLWLGFSTGKICVVDVQDGMLVAEWKGHQTAVISLVTLNNVNLKIRNTLMRPLISLCDSACVASWDATVKEITINRQVEEHLQEYCDRKKMNIQVCSWNVDSQRPPSEDNESFWRSWLCLEDPANVIVIALQEIVDLGSKSANAKLILGNGGNNGLENLTSQEEGLWMERILKVLKGDYKVMGKTSMLGLFLCILQRKSISNVKGLAWDLVKTGLGGLHGNKGGIVGRFIVEDTSICILNCHLAAGHSQTVARNTDASTILKMARLPIHVGREGVFGNLTGESVGDHEYVVFVGDLNYRLNMSRDGVEESIHGKEYGKLIQHDQLSQQKGKVLGHPLSSFKEAAINFAPTYKYDRNTDTFDSSEKQRVPAYCDRILVKTNSDLLIDQYKSHPEMKCSDHRPISAHLSITVKKIDFLKREQVRLTLLQEWLTTKKV